MLAQRVLDDSSSLAMRAQQADAEQARRDDMQAAALVTGGADAGPGLREEVANTEKDDASVISTVMAVAMAMTMVMAMLMIIVMIIAIRVIREIIAKMMWPQLPIGSTL